MKRIISTLIVITITLILLPHASADLNDGMVAYWPFSGDANDASGNGHHGTVVGPTLTLDRFGNSASAYSFDGVNDYIDIPYSPSIEPSVFSLSIWFKSSSSNQGALWSTDPNSYYCNHGYMITLRGNNAHPSLPVVPDGTPQFFIDPTTSCRAYEQTISGDSPLNDGNWHHIVAKYDGSHRDMYVDGVLQNETKDTTYSKTHASIRIGMTRRTNNHPEWRWFYKGNIDDIRLYDRVLTNSEILDLFNENCGFVDVPPGHWAEKYICKIYDEEITKGCSQNPLKYCPFDPVTRAQMAALIVRAVEGEPPADYCDAGSPFPDVSPDTWPCKYIKRLLELGITKGCGDGKYCPNDNVTRAQMATFIVRAVEGEPPADYCDTGSPFTDVPANTWPCKYIKRLLELGITKGCGDGKYCPNRNVTRAEMAAFLGRAFLGMD